MGIASPIPDGYAGAIPYLTVHDGVRALEFYQQAFGAVEIMRMADPKGRIGHAEFKIGNQIIMLSDEHPEMGVVSPKTLGGTPCALMFYFQDVDAVVEQAVAAGAKIVRPVANQFYGDRSGKLEDPFGHIWWVATHIEDVSPEEMQRRAAALYGA
ncbi:MAG: Glyoxalase/bleomycin resistance protein/dioxygenase [Planctomycetaceae bacterium]|nr:Glyoxalase/bleomycin resistance protein/dioxygenase [Planctomycetaceae bacterium]